MTAVHARLVKMLTIFHACVMGGTAAVMRDERAW